MKSCAAVLGVCLLVTAPDANFAAVAEAASAYSMTPEGRALTEPLVEGTKKWVTVQLAEVNDTSDSTPEPYLG